MKKVINIFFSLTCILAVGQTQVTAQVNEYAITTSASNFGNSNSGETANSAYKVSTKVYNDFSKKFRKAYDISWITAGDVNYVDFKENGVTARGTYNSKGKLQHVIKYYHGAKVPARFAELMWRNGYRMSITQVIEIKSLYTTTHIVKMEDAKSYLTIQVHPNSDLSVYENYYKPE